MDHGPPTVVDDGGEVLVVSDEHITFAPSAAVRVGDRVRLIPAHVDPTVAYHERLHLERAGEIIDVWPVDLRGW
jgi:D-serine deaminase-like pyridoxal phosphate-dependent protein